MTNPGTKWSCHDRRIANRKTKSVCRNHGMTNLGQDWLCADRRKYSVGRQNVFSKHRMTNPGQDWLCSHRCMTNPGQDWSCIDLTKESRHSRRSLFAVLAFQKEYYRTFYASKAKFFGKNNGIITKKRYFCKLNRYVTSACNQNSRKLYASFFLTQIIMNSHELSVCKAGHI